MTPWSKARPMHPGWEIHTYRYAHGVGSELAWASSWFCMGERDAE